MKKDKLFTRKFLLLTTANLFMAVSFYFMTPMMALFMSDTFGFSNEQIGLSMFSFTISAILVRPFSGFLLDSMSRYHLYLFSLILLGLAYLGYPFVATFVFLLILRFAHGIMWGSINTAGYTLIVDLVPECRRGEGLGVFGLSMSIAMSVGPMMAVVISKSFGYNTLFYSAFAFCLFATILVFFIGDEKKSKYNFVKLKKSFTLKKMFATDTLPVAINMLICQIPYGGIISFIAIYGRHVGVSNSGTIFTILAIAIIVSRVLSGYLFDRYGPRTIVSVGLLLLVCGLFSVGYFNSPVGFHLSGIVLGLGFGIISPTFQAMANKNVAPERRGAVNSTYLMLSDTGIGIGMLLFGSLIDIIGYASTFYVSSVLQGIALLFFVFVTLPKYRKRL